MDPGKCVCFPARYGHSSVVDNNGKMWVIAGYITGAGADPPILSGEFSISRWEAGGTPVTTNTTWYALTDMRGYRQTHLHFRQGTAIRLLFQMMARYG